MQVLAVRFDLNLPQPRSLKAKRAVLRPVIEGLRVRYSLSVAEVDHHDLWQRTSIGVAIVSADVGHAVDVADEVERFVWSRPDVEVSAVTRTWLEMEAL